MKAARIPVLAVALAAGGTAAFLIRSDEEKGPETPLAQIATTDVLIAKSDVGMGTAISSQYLQLDTVSFTLRSAPDASRAGEEERKCDINNVLFGVSNT